MVWSCCLSSRAARLASKGRVPLIGPSVTSISTRVLLAEIAATAILETAAVEFASGDDASMTGAIAVAGAAVVELIDQ